MFKMIFGKGQELEESLDSLLLCLKCYKQQLCPVHLRNVGRSDNPAEGGGALCSSSVTRPH